MKRKSLFIIVSMITFLMLVGAASALTIDTSKIPSELSQDGGSFKVNITNDNPENSTNVNISINKIGDIQSQISFNIEENGDQHLISLNSNESLELDITYSVTSNFDFKLGETYSTKLLVNGNNEKDLIFKETSFCDGIENQANIDLKIEDFKVLNGFGDEDDYWYLLDEVEIELTIEPSIYDIEDVEVEWELQNTNGKKIDDGDFSVSDIDEDEDETVTFTITLDSNIDDFDGEDAVLYVRAIGKVDDKDSIYDGDKSCDWKSNNNIDIITKDDFVIASDFEVNGVKFNDDIFSESFSCGSEITFSGKLYNIGEDRQDDVSVEIYSKDLELYEKFDFSEIDSYENEEFTYTLTIPQEIDEKNYYIQVEVFDEDGDIYENSEDDVALVKKYIKVEGNCKVVPPKVYAKLESDAISGREATVTATVTNNEEGNKLYTIVPQDYSDWAEVTGFSPQVLSLESGESEDVTFTLMINNGLEGDQTFNIAIMDGENTAIVQPVTLPVEKGIFSVKDYMTRDNLQIAGIVLLNLILLIAIIIVARKIIRKK